MALLQDENGTTSIEWLVVCGLVILVLAAALVAVVDTLRSRIADFESEL